MRCGTALSWRVRRDAKFCGQACRQADYRRRAVRGIPAELSRELDDVDTGFYYQLPYLYSLDPRPLLRVRYRQPATCEWCGEPILEGFVFGRSALFPDESGPFCNGTCIFDGAHARRDD